MWSRREFFQSLSVIPIAITELRFDLSVYHLEVDCDLSLTALQYAINTGVDKKLGRPRTLIVGPELLFVARELLWRPEYVKEIDDDITYVIRYNLPRYLWRLQFDHGVIESGIVL
jgi:hypothetical protein